MSKTLTKSNILICGSSRVGKSTLMNAICQENLTKTNISLNSSTKQIDQYSFQSTIGNSTHETIFWDTPGIESWNENDIQQYINLLFEKSQPICLIYCASPGSFALSNHLVWIISKCKEKNIFSALVCTNMWSGKHRNIVIKELSDILNKVYPNIEPHKEDDDIIYYDHVGLVTMVNSIEYIDEDFDVKKPQSGINELIFGISKSLQRDFMFSWLKTVSHNKTFWNNMSSKLNDLLKIPYEKLNTICQHADQFLEYIFNPFTDEQDYYYNNSSNDQTDKNLFYDAEMIDIPKKDILRFTLKSKKTALELGEILAKLGVKSMNFIQEEIENEQKWIINAKFDDDDQLKIIYDLCQIFIYEEINCTIINERRETD